MRTQEGVRAEARTMELRAVAQLGRAAARSPTPPCRRPAAAPAAPAAPCAPPYGRSNSAVAPQSRRRASDIALWRRACASPTLSMRALPARTPCGRHRNPSSEPAGGSLLPPPPPSSAGAAAPSSLVLPICTEKNSVSKSPPQGDFFLGLRRAIFLYGEDLTGSAVGRYLRGRSSAVKFSIVLSSFRVRIVRSRRAGGKTWCTRCPGTVQPWAHDGAPQRDVWGAARRFSCGSGVQSAPGNRGDGVCGLLWRSSRSPRRRPAAPG